jgi:hypothetical protein
MAVKAHDCKRSSYIVVASKQVFMESLSLSLFLSVYILYTYIQALCVEKECQKPFGFSLSFLLFVEFDGGEEKENFLIRVFYLAASSLDNYNARLF